MKSAASRVFLDLPSFYGDVVRIRIRATASAAWEVADPAAYC
jgi:hypothetical protein